MMRLILRRSMPRVAGYPTLAVACVVPGPHHQLHRWRASRHGWCTLLRRQCSPVRMARGDGGRLRMCAGSDEGS